MSRPSKVPAPLLAAPDAVSKPLAQYGCGPIQFAGTDNAFYERHPVFDNVIGLKAAGPRERFEAFAHCVRDILSMVERIGDLLGYDLQALLAGHQPTPRTAKVPR